MAFREDFQSFGKSETIIVHCDHIMLFLPNQDEIGYFVNRGPHKHHSCKLFGSKGWVVSEKKIKMWKVYG